MSFLSACFYILANYRFLIVFVLPLACLAIAILVHIYRGNRRGYFLIPSVFTLALINAFTGQWVNAAFLNQFGTYGTAIIVQARDAGWLFNAQKVNEYEVLLRTAENEDLIVNINDTTAAIWPPRNLVLIPAVNVPFVVKYMPGFPRNMVIMSDESDYGKQLLLNEARRSVDRARNLHAASPENHRFANDYRKTLETFLNNYGNALSEQERREYQDELQRLDLREKE